jgi:AcrR family transcriptional regulator
MQNERNRMPAAVRQNDIIEKAIQVLANGHNYRSATTAKIAREADVSEPTIYKYFGSKKELFLAVLERIRENILSEWWEVASGIDRPEEALRTYASYHYRFIQENKAVEKILFQAVSEVDDPEIKEELLSLFSSMVEFVAFLIKQGKDQGVVDPSLDDVMAGWLIVSLSLGSGVLSLFGFDDEVDIERLTQAFEGFLRAFTT